MLSNYTNFYNTQSMKIGSGYYIHYKTENIGRLQHGKPNDIYRVFSNYKHTVVKNTKTHYKNLLLENIKNTNQKDVQNYINDLVNNNKIDELDNIIKTSLQDNFVDETRIQKILNLNKGEKKVFGGKSNVESNLKKLTEQLNRILAIVGEGLDLYKSNGKEMLTAIQLMNSENGNWQEYYSSELQKRIKKYKSKLKGNVVTINNQQIAKVMNRLQVLVEDLKENRTRSAKKNVNGEYPSLTFDAIKNLFEKEIFSTGLGEAIGIKCDTIATNTVLKTLVNNKTGKNESLDFTGSKSVSIHVSDADGNIINETTGNPAPGKKDIALNNVTLSLEDIPSMQGKNEGGQLKFNIGISAKFYQNIDYSSNDKTKREFDLGAGLKLDQALAMTFNQERLLYLAYNIFAKNDETEIKTPLMNLQDCIFTRSIIHNFSSRGGGEDFANYLLLNGEIVSIWDIINYVAKNNIGITRSQEVNTQGVVFSLHPSDARKQMTSYKDKKINGRVLQDVINERASIVANAIKATSLKGYIRPRELARALGRE